MELHSGTFSQDNGRFGFIKVVNAKDVFVMPAACKAFGGMFPPLGTKVTFEIIVDGKTGRPRAENVQLLETAAMAAGISGNFDILAAVAAAEESFAQSWADPYGAGYAQLAQTQANIGRHMGAIQSDNGRFGFIRMVDGSDMFVMPAACRECGSADRLPPLGTQVIFEVVTDTKTGRPRAENVQLLDGANAWSPPVPAASSALGAGPDLSQIMAAAAAKGDMSQLLGLCGVQPPPQASPDHCADHAWRAASAAAGEMSPYGMCGVQPPALAASPILAYGSADAATAYGAPFEAAAASDGRDRSRSRGRNIPQ